MLFNGKRFRTLEITTSDMSAYRMRRGVDPIYTTLVQVTNITKVVQISFLFTLFLLIRNNMLSPDPLAYNRAHNKAANRPFSDPTKEPGSSVVFIQFYTRSSIEWR